MGILTPKSRNRIFPLGIIFSVLLALITVFACEVEEPVPTYTLTTSVTPSEGGKISVTPQESNYVEGSQVTLTPEPNENWVFKQWEGDATGSTTPLQITMTSNKSITGVFVKRDYPLNIKIEGEGTVEEKIVPNPSGREYPHGTTVELTPKPKEGWEFESWSGDLEGKESPKRIIVDKQKNVTAKFVIIDPLKDFQGYKVDPNAKNLGTEYWTNVKIQPDLIVNIFKEPLPGHIGASLSGTTCGDFNNDGWVDVFNPGWAYNGPRFGVGFLIWNPVTKLFEDKNLLNDKRITFGGNNRKTIPVYLNNDNYVDLVVFDNGDEGIQDSPAQPMRILLSDGKGGYDLKEIQSETPLIKHESGEVADLNNDGFPELLIACGPVWFIMWGIPDFPYFSTTNMGIFHCTPDNHLGFKNNNGFGEAVPEISNGVYGFKIDDLNKDGWRDIILFTSETKNYQPYPVSTRILINQGNGKFNKNSVISLPYYDGTNMITVEDAICEDVNSDGKIDIISVIHFWDYKSWDIFAFVQQQDGSFKIDKNVIKFNYPKKGNWKPELFYVDLNNDGLKDIGYYNDASMNKNETNNLMGFKTVFIREGNLFTEKDYFQFDPYANYLKKTFLK